MDVSGKSLSDSLEADIKGMGDAEQERWAAGNQDDWVWEGHELAIADVYQKLHVPLEPVIFPKNCDSAPLDITGFKPTSRWRLHRRDEARRQNATQQGGSAAGPIVE